MSPASLLNSTAPSPRHQILIKLISSSRPTEPKVKVPYTVEYSRHLSSKRTAFLILVCSQKWTRPGSNHGWNHNLLNVFQSWNTSAVGELHEIRSLLTPSWSPPKVKPVKHLQVEPCWCHQTPSSEGPGSRRVTLNLKKVSHFPSVSAQCDLMQARPVKQENTITSV